MKRSIRKSIFILAAFIATSVPAETPEETAKQLAALTQARVKCTDTYWDLGSVGITFLSDKDQLFFIKTLNLRLSPERRTLLLSFAPDQKGVAVPPGSEIERQLIRLVQTQPKEDIRGAEVARNVLTILKDRDTPWGSTRWYTLEYLEERFPKPQDLKKTTD
jgi:hypothetical protein